MSKRERIKGLLDRVGRMAAKEERFKRTPRRYSTVNVNGYRESGDLKVTNRYKNRAVRTFWGVGKWIRDN